MAIHASRVPCGVLGSRRPWLLPTAALLLAAVALGDGNEQNVLYTWETVVEGCDQVINHGNLAYGQTEDGGRADRLKAVAHQTSLKARNFWDIGQTLDDCLAQAHHNGQLQHNGHQQHNQVLSAHDCKARWEQHVTSQHVGIDAQFLDRDHHYQLAPGWAGIPELGARPDAAQGNSRRISKVGITTAGSLYEAHDKAVERMNDYFGAMLSTMIRLSGNVVCSAEPPRLYGLVYIPNAMGAVSEVEDRTHRALTHFRAWQHGQADTPPDAHACDMSRPLGLVKRLTPRYRQTGTTELNSEHGPYAAQVMFYCTAKFLEATHLADWGEVRTWTIGDNL